MTRPAEGSMATSLLVKPAVKRLAGEQASRREAVVAAVAAAVAAGVLVYRLLRSGGEPMP